MKYSRERKYILEIRIYIYMDSFLYGSVLCLLILLLNVLRSVFPVSEFKGRVIVHHAVKI